MIICNQALKPSQNLFNIDKKQSVAFLIVNRRMKD